MVAALIGLVGALGGVLAGAYLTDLREQRRAKVARQDEVRVAARLILHELQTIHTNVIASPDRAEPVPTPEWTEHRATLARVMDEAGWQAVAASYTLLEAASLGHHRLLAGGTREIRRAEAKLSALLLWVHDESDEDEVLRAYQSHLESLTRAKRRRDARVPDQE